MVDKSFSDLYFFQVPKFWLELLRRLVSCLRRASEGVTEKRPLKSTSFTSRRRSNKRIICRLSFQFLSFLRFDLLYK